MVSLGLQAIAGADDDSCERTLLWYVQRRYSDDTASRVSRLATRGPLNAPSIQFGHMRPEARRIYSYASTLPHPRFQVPGSQYGTPPLESARSGNKSWARHLLIPHTPNLSHQKSPTLVRVLHRAPPGLITACLRHRGGRYAMRTCLGISHARQHVLMVSEEVGCVSKVVMVMARCHDARRSARTA